MEIFGALNGAVSALVFVRERANKLKINQLQIERLMVRCQDFIAFLDAMSKMKNVHGLANELESLLVDIELFVTGHAKCQLLQRIFNADGLHRSLKDYNERLTALADSVDCQLFLDADAIRREDEEDIKLDNKMIMSYIKELESRESMLIDALELREEQFVEALFIMERRLKVVKCEAEKQFLLAASSYIYRISNCQQPSKPKWLKPQWEVTLKHKLASGAFGDVYVGEWNSCTVAIKVMRKTEHQKESLKEFVNEVELWYNELNNHPHVLSLYGACHTVENPFMIFEYMDNGHLLQYLNHFPEQSIRTLREAALGIRHLHENGVIHGDIKAINILINGEGIAKIADFGFTFARDTNSEIIMGGTLRWLAPELLLRHRPDYPSDVYAFGITIYEVFNKHNLPPYIGESEENITMMILNGILPAKLINIEPFVWSIIEECLRFNPTERSCLLQVIDQLSSSPDSNINKPVPYASNDDFDEQLAESAAKIKIESAAASSTFLNKCNLLFKSGDEASIVEAINILYAEACAGSVKAQIRLGQMHCSGEILNYDLQIALAYFKKATESDLDIAHYSLAYFYIKELKPQNIKKGFKHLLKAVNKGNTAAMTFYGKELLKEQPEEAFRWFQKAADQNYKKAFLNLGLCYLNGMGCIKDIPKAVQTLTVSAEQGNNPAAWRILGTIFANLDSDPLLFQYCDLQKAMRCFKSAIKLGYKDTYIELYRLYFQGFTLEMNKSERIAKSKSVLLQAIDKSVIPAYYLMGNSYEHGIHQPIHLESALHFYKLGEKRNCPKCKLALENFILNARQR